MRSNGLGRGRVAKGISLLVLSVGLALLPSAAFGSCVTEWKGCREDADKEFRENRANVFQYAWLLTGCDIGYGVCSLGKSKGDTK